MGREQTGIADLGPIGILRESSKLLWNHGKAFSLIQLTLVLPSTTFAVALDFIISQHQSEIFPPPPLRDSGRASHPYESQARFSFGDCNSFLPAMQFLGISFFSALVNQVFLALWISAVLYAVGLSYANKSVSFLDVVREIPRLWKRLVFTPLFGRILFFMYLIAYLNAGLDLFLLTIFNLGPYWILLPSVVNTLAAIYGGIIIPFTLALIYGGIIVPLARDAKILDDSDFWADLKKGVLGKTWVPIGVLVLSFVPASIPLCLRLVLQTIFSKDPWSPTPLVLCVIYVLSMSLVSQLTSLSGGILYVSFEAFHMESNSREFIFLNGVTQGVYQPVPNEIDSNSLVDPQKTATIGRVSMA